MRSVARIVLAAAGILPLLSAALHGQRLMELDGIQLRGSARVMAYGAATCEIGKAPPATTRPTTR